MPEKTVLFSDIAGSTRIYEEKGDETARQLLMDCVEVMSGVVEKSGGKVIERIGDEIMCTFDTPDSAAKATGVMHSQIAFAYATGKLGYNMRIRIGFVHGRIIETDEGLFGNVVHRASRICSLAKAGQTLTNKETLELLEPGLRQNSRFHQNTMLKGLTGEQEIHELIWNRVGSTTFQMFPTKPKTKKGGKQESRVEVEYGGRKWTVDARSPHLEIGRHAACDIRVIGRSVSHLHARVTWNRGRAWLEDLSTNGTVMEPKGGTATRLHRETVPLAGDGILRLGAMVEEGEPGALVRFRCGESGT